MSDRTDETARAMLEINCVEKNIQVPHTKWFNSHFQSDAGAEIPFVRLVPFAMLQKWAAFWLLRKELVFDIEAIMQGLNESRVHFGDCSYEEIEIDALTKLLDKIKELDG